MPTLALTCDLIFTHLHQKDRFLRPASVKTLITQSCLCNIHINHNEESLLKLLRPPLNKKSFPVERPGGIILRLYPAVFFCFLFFFKLKYFSHFSFDFQTIFTIVYRIIRRLHKKKNISKKKKYFPAARVVLFYLTRPTGNDFLLKGGLTTNIESPQITMSKHSSVPSVKDTLLLRSLVKLIPKYFYAYLLRDWSLITGRGGGYKTGGGGT